MVIQYNITVTIINLTDNSTENYNKTFSSEITADNDNLLYNNHHTIVKSANILNMFDEEISAYCSAHNIQKESVDIDEFEIVSLTDRVDVYFESYGDNSIQLSPVIMAYVYPKNDALRVPVLTGKVYDENTIIWAWPEDEAYAHYLIELPEGSSSTPYTVIATIPIGMTSYAETGLDPDTTYTRRLINYTAEQTSAPSEAVTLHTKQISPKISAEEYNTARNYDFTSVDTERENDNENYDAFHSGIGHGNDLKVYKQMDVGVPQRFKPLFKISGRRIQREKRYDQTGFKYKLCLEAIEEIEEQEGEVTFDVHAYERQSIKLREYVWVTKPVTVHSRFSCDVFLRKTNARDDERNTIPTYSPVFRHVSRTHTAYTDEVPGQEEYWDVPPSTQEGTKTEAPQDYWEITPAVYELNGGSKKANSLRILFCIDCTASLRDYAVGRFVDSLCGFKANASDFYNSRESGNNSKWQKWVSSNNVYDDAKPPEEKSTLITYAYGYHENKTGKGDGVHNNVVNRHNLGAIRYVRNRILNIAKNAEEYVKESMRTATVKYGEDYNNLDDFITNIKENLPGHDDTDFPVFQSEMIPLLDEETGEPMIDEETGEPMMTAKTDQNGKVIISPKLDSSGNQVEMDIFDIIDEEKAKNPDLCYVKISNEEEYRQNSTGTSTNIDVKFGLVLWGSYYYIPKAQWLTADELETYLGDDNGTGSDSFTAIAGHSLNPSGTTSSGSSKSDGFTKATDWGAGLAGAEAFMNSVSVGEDTSSILFFFSDGFPNTVNGDTDGKWTSTNRTLKSTSENDSVRMVNSDYGVTTKISVSSSKLKIPDANTIKEDLKNHIASIEGKFTTRILLTCSFQDYMFVTDGTDNVTFESGDGGETHCYNKSYIDYVSGFAPNTSYSSKNTLKKRLAKKSKYVIGSIRGDGGKDKYHVYRWDRETMESIFKAAVNSLVENVGYTLKTPIKAEQKFAEPKVVPVEIKIPGEGYHPAVDPIPPQPFTVYDGESIIFDGWEQNNTTRVIAYDVDDYTTVHIEHEFPPFVINEALTPVVYSPAEKRAVISSILAQRPITNQSIWEIIWPKIQDTEAYKSGYTQTIGTVEASEAEEDTFLVSGFQIEDSYVLDDGSTYNPDDLTYDDGWSGSINVYTDINKLGTTSYSDDCYICKKGTLAQGANPIYIQGYSDGIIFDGVMFHETELNAFDNPSRVMISESDNSPYEIMRNRMNKNLKINVNDDHSELCRYVNVLSKGDAIDITSTDVVTGKALYNQRAAQLPRGFGEIAVSIALKYSSPVLNYRFNLEDPNSLTPLYEIMPECNRLSKNKNIVVLHVYYAKNVYITDMNHYVESFGDDPNVTNAAPFLYSVNSSGGDDNQIEEGFCKWSTKDVETNGVRDNTWYIDQYIWFSAKPMRKIQEYYDELPKDGMDPFYGLVNGRYSSSNVNGMRDLRLQVSSFNIPTTVMDKHAESVKIYVLIQEYVPSNTIVSYKWDHPYNNMDSITQTNGDFITFHSESVTHKDQEYIDSLATIDMPSEYIDGGESKEEVYTINKPSSVYDYVEYFFDAVTDNSDVMTMRFPSTITFDENDVAEVGIMYKNVINSTSKWSPRIHNGYYYLNQHEYYAYSAFDVEADFETSSLREYREMEGSIAIDVNLRKPAGPAENYSVTKATRAELIQDELRFQWIDGEGLTAAISMNGKYYKEYYTPEYISPPIVFKNILTTAGRLKVNMKFGTNENYTVPMSIRGYILEEGKWSDWTPFTNDTVPPMLSYAYQVKFNVIPSVSTSDIFLDDYLCCYLDWKEEWSEDECVNISTFGDFMTTGEYDASGMFMSKLFDNGCVAQMAFDIFESKYNGVIRIFIATANDSPKSLDEGYIRWEEITDSPGQYFEGRYYKYRVLIPAGEKLYWIRRRVQTKQTNAIMPYIRSISMTGTYAPTDTTDMLINVESFPIKTDMQEYVVIPNILDKIYSDVLAKGFEPSEIEKVRLRLLSSGITLRYDERINSNYPLNYLSTPVIAKSETEDFTVRMVNTPYIYPTRDTSGNEVMIIHGTPQQYSPITVEDMNGKPYVQLFDGSDISLERNPITSTVTGFAKIEEEITLVEDAKYYELRRNDYEKTTLKVLVNGSFRNSITYNVVNHLIIFNEPLSTGDVLHVEYMVPNSFVAVIDRENDTTYIYTYSNKSSYMLNSIGGQRIKYKVFFETNKEDNKFVAEDLSLNPVYRTDYEGFIYLTDEHNEPDKIRIFCDPLRLRAGGYDKTDVSVEVVDIHNNPVINKRVEVDCIYGILTVDSTVTDINGVIHLVYESSFAAAVDTLTARTLKDDNTVVEASIQIISE